MDKLCCDVVMKCYLIITILGGDRTGIVSSLADIVADHDGSWMESRMAKLAGQFAGIVRVECEDDKADSLINALQTQGSESGLSVQVVRDTSPENPKGEIWNVDVMGNDRAGIVRELTAAIAKAGGNVEELTTGLESAPMSGHPMFRAHGEITIADSSSVDTLTSAIESLGDDLTVDISMAD